MNIKQKHLVIPIIVLAASLLATIVSFRFIENYEQQFAASNFENGVTDLEGRINERVNLYRGSVLGAVGLFNASNEVSKDEWRTYVESAKIKERFPGVVGLGFGQSVTAQQKDQFVQNMRNSGSPQFSIWPESVSDVYVPVVFFHPEDETIRKIYGYNMLSEPIRQEAAARAAETGELAVSKKVDLVLYPGRSTVLIFSPIYNKNVELNTVEKRRQNIYGYVYSPVLLDEFIKDISLDTNPELHFQIFEGSNNDLSTSEMLYDSGPETTHPGYLSQFSTTRVINWGGQEWTIRFITGSGYGLSFFQQYFSWIVLILGLILTAGLTLLVRMSLASTPQAMQKIHDDLADLQELVENREMIIDSEPFGLITTDQEGNINVFNLEAERKLGYSEDAVRGMSFLTLLSKTELAHRTAMLIQQTGIKHEPGFDTIVTEAVIEGQDKTEWTFITHNNQEMRLDVLIKPLYSTQNQLLGYEFII